MAQQTKLSKLKTAMAENDHRTALQIAAKFPRLGEHRDAITQAWSAIRNPGFYRSIGRDPDALFSAGIAAIRDRYGIV